MRTRVSSATLFLIALLLLLAGCGGGGDQSGSGGGEQQNDGQAQNGGEEQAQQGGGDQGGGAANQGAAQVKVALGTIESVQADNRMIVLKPSTEIQGGEQITFKVRKTAEISVNDQEAEMADIEAGQQAQIQYVTRQEENRALAVQVVEGG